jgi:hypothetical protein
MSGSNRVKSKNTPKAQASAKASKQLEDGQDEDGDGEDAEEGEDAALEAENGENEPNEEEDDPEIGEDAENEPEEAKTLSDLSAQHPKAASRRVKAPQAKPIPEGMRALLDSPQDFGIWVKHPIPSDDDKPKYEQKLHRFRKGKTPLTDIEHEACQLHGYVADNGAKIVYRPLPTKK